MAPQSCVNLALAPKLARGGHKVYVAAMENEELHEAMTWDHGLKISDL